METSFALVYPVVEALPAATLPLGLAKIHVRHVAEALLAAASFDLEEEAELHAAPIAAATNRTQPSRPIH